MQTYTDFQIASLEYFEEISFHCPCNKRWNFFKNNEFIIFCIVTSQPIPQADVFYIDGTKDTKAPFWSLKEYNVFYTKFHSAQQNELYALIQIIHLHSHPINIVSDSLYSVFILGNIETSIIHSNQPIIQQHFLKLQSLIRDHTSPIYITHIQTHSCFSGPMTHGNKQANKLVSFATPKEQHALLHNNASPLHQIFKIPYRHAKEIINNCSTCRPLHLQPIAQDVNPRGLQLNKLWQMDITHCPELSPSSFPHVCINPNFFIWATPL